MCSHKNITWEITDNSITDRMIDNSLIHKFKSSQKLRRRTKVLNAEIKKHCNLESYKHYVELKTNVLRNLTEDTDTDNSSSLTDIDYDIIYSSPSKQAKYVAKNSKRYIFSSEEDCEGCKVKNTKREKKGRNKSTERRNEKQTRKSPRVKNTVVSKKCIDIDWQEVTKENSNIYTSRLRKRVHTNMSHNERNISEDNDCNSSKTQSSRQSLSPRFDSQNSTVSNIMKSGNEYMKQDHRDSHAMNNELNSEDNATPNKTKPVSNRKVRSYQNQNATNKSNIELNSHNLHYQSSPSRSTNLENSNDSDELNTLIELKDKSNKLTAVTNESSNTKNYDNTYMSHKSELLKNVRRNLIPALEKADSMNNDEDIQIDKSVEDKLNYDQLLPTITSLSRHSTPLKKTQTNTSKIKDLLPDASSLDQQKDSGIDEDSQDRFDKLKESNKIPMNQNMVENAEKTVEKPISFQQKKIDEVIETAEDCKKDVKDAHLKFNNNILEEQISKEEKESSEEKEIKNSSQLNQIDMNIEINQEDKENSNDIQKQQLLSPKQDCMRDVHSKSCNHIQKEEDNREVKKPFEEVSLQLNKVDKDAEVSSINYEEKQDNKEEEEFSGEEMQNFLQLNRIDNTTEIYSTNQEGKTHFVKSKDSCDIQKQQLLSSKENHIKDIHLKSYNNILDENNRQVIEEKEEKNFLQLNQDNKNAKMYLNQKDKACMKLEDTHDIRKQQLLPKVMCTEILNKKYKILKKDNDESIEKIDNINNNTDIADTLIHRPDIINHNTDNWQEMINEEEINTSVILETEEDDNEEDDLNYVSPQIKKRLQQQARLNLVVSSDSPSENDDEYVTTKSREHSSDISHSNEDDRLKNDEINCASKQTKMDISHGENICEDVCIRKETTSVPVEIVKLDSINIKEKIKKKAKSLTRCTYENDSFQSTNKNLQEEAQCCENVYNSDQSEDGENFQLRFSENNVSCNSEESINQFQKHKQFSLLDKENTYSKSNLNEKIISVELGTKHKSEDEQSAQASIKSSNTHLNISYQYRPCNLQELIEDQKLIVETMPASFTLADLSEDEEAFILNIPSKVIQNNLQGQLLTLKEKSIKFNENKFRIVCKEVGTTSCIFATGKRRKPYKIINIKNINTITVREKLPRSKNSDVSNSYNTVSSVSKPTKINNQQTDETDSKRLKVSNRRYKKRKQRESSDSETGSALKKKKRLKMIYS